MVLKRMKRLRSNLGFTLAELMIAMLILSMVTAVAAGGIPVAINAYTRVVDTANAQVLLSTTMTKLREELGTASEIKLPTPDDPADPVLGTVETRNGKKVVTYTGGEIRFISENGSESRIYKEYNGEKGIHIREYADIDFEEKATDPDKYLHLLVSKSAANKNLYVTFGNIEWIEDDGILEIKNVEVWSDSGAKLADLEYTLAEDEDFNNPNGSIKIRVLSYIY